MSRRQPASLEYLSLQRQTTQSQSFAFSPDVVTSLGACEKTRKGTTNKSSMPDGGAPWEPVPEELRDKTVSLYGADFTLRPPIQEYHEKLDEMGMPDIVAKLKRKPMTSPRRKQMTPDPSLDGPATPAVAAAYEQEFERLTRNPPQGEEIKHFSHKGVSFRSASAPLDREADALEQPGSARRLKNEAKKIDTETTRRPSTFWYAHDRQRFKHRMLEEQRMTDWQADLLNQGWAKSTNPCGPDKHVPKSSLLSGISQERKDKIEQDLQEFLEAKAQRDSEARKRYNATIAKPRPSELRGVIPVLSQPLANETASCPPDLVRNTAKNIPPHPGAEFSEIDGPPEDGTDEEGFIQVRQRVPAFMFDRPPPFNPLPSFRSELPGAPVPKQLLEKLKLPSDADPEAAKVAPPWGRPTALDEQWEKQRKNVSKSHISSNQTAHRIPTKRDITKELRIVRDKGLLKRERKKLTDTMTATQVAFIKSIPSTGPLATSNVHMKQASRPTPASL